MAKAGLFLPQAPAEQQGAGEAPQALLWFDQVLADLGDGQSLQQSLSTFSGHVRRIRNVLAAATPQVGIHATPSWGPCRGSCGQRDLRSTLLRHAAVPAYPGKSGFDRTRKPLLGISIPMPSQSLLHACPPAVPGPAG